MNDAELPRLFSAVLDEPTLARLFEELGAAEVLEVTLRQPGALRSSPERVTLAEARRALASGAAAGAQIRYRHAASQWVDTLLATPEGTKLVRIAAPA